MDPITQGALGAAVNQSGSFFKSTRKLRRVGVIGALAAMSPDLDVLIRSNEDPLLFLEYHRQFTHSLIFIPFGALICCLALHPLLGRKVGFSFNTSFLICLAGYATHAVLDACTTYGTMLLWPFSDIRVAWNNISVVDPFYTLPILFLIGLSAWRGNPWFSRVALFWILVYPAIGVIQRERAESMAEQWLQAHNIEAINVDAKPSLGNLVLWKIVYETEQDYHVDAVRVGFLGKEMNRYYEGDRVAKLDLQRDFPWLDPQSQQAKDVERFRWFSNGFVAKDPNNPNRIIDIRYSIVPNEIAALWSIELDPHAGAQQHVAYASHRDRSAQQRERFFSMVLAAE